MKGKPSDLLKKDNNMETLTKDFSTGAIVWYNLSHHAIFYIYIQADRMTLSVLFLKEKDVLILAI